MEKFGGTLDVGWEKVAYWCTKVAISLKRVKKEEKLLWSMEGLYRKSPTSLSISFGSSPYFYFRFRLYGPFYLTYFSPYSPAIGTRWYKWTF